MKKQIVLLLALALVFSLAACGAKNDGTKPQATKPQETKPQATKPQETKPQATKPQETKPQATEPQETKPQGTTDVTPKVDADTLGGKLWDAFKASDLSASAEDVANALITSDFIPFMGMSMPVEEGTLTGFDNYEVKGFADGAVFAPGIGSIPFVGYIFKLADGADVQGFISNLTSHCNPRWNICTEADQTVAGSVGNTVFFLMCTASFDAE